MKEKLKQYYLANHQFVNGVVLGATVGAMVMYKYGKMPMPDAPHLYLPDQFVTTLIENADEAIIFATPQGDLALTALVTA